MSYPGDPLVAAVLFAVFVTVGARAQSCLEAAGPVVQDAMLPTVAYIGGPAELAHLAQSGGPRARRGFRP